MPPVDCPPSSPLYVVKVGGSLFDCKNLAEMLQDWSEQQAPARMVFVAGGGPIVNAIRQADRQWQLGEATSHWLAIDAMDISAKILGKLIPDALLVHDYKMLEREVMQPTSRVVFSAATFLRSEEPAMPGRQLPIGWAVTSDSIGARLAELLEADALILLKSTDLHCVNPEVPSSVGNRAAAWAAARLVDKHFPQAVQDLPAVKWINFRKITRGECSP